MRFFGFKYGVLWMVVSLLLSHQITAQNTTQIAAPSSSGPKFDIKMAVVMIVLVVVFFILGFLSVYTRQCAQTRLGGRADLARERMMARGLDPAVIESFPAFLFSDVKGLHLGKDSLQCAVCLNDFQDDETLRLIPVCDHVFHPDCIDTWLISHSTCPVCRAYLEPKPGEEPYSALMELIDQEASRLEAEEAAAGPKLPRDESVRVVEDQIKQEEETPKINLINVNDPANQRLPPRSRSTGFGPRSRSTGFGPPRSGSTGRQFARMLFPRSQSTGHNLLVQPGENTEKFTLRLPEEVRARLMNMALTRAKSTSVFPRAGSVRQGYRSGSVRGERNGLDRFEGSSRSNRWGFSMMPPFLSRSVRQQPVVDSDVATQSAVAAPGSNKSPERVVIVVDEERSTNALQQKG
ncbi:RING-H2 finger protein ATL34-like [Argentina anserina]|uniref:RING-H2 finger protein ATL34-like n=1 Tax=Argentina anserina TaxID=57926 RepID=UPI0021763E5C|nr:RING-H2 finger protein ATL34-like [Potentilla anserina]